MSEQLALAVDPPREVEQLGARLGVHWRAIEAARARADATLARLPAAVEDCLPPGTCFIAFGSLVRREITTGSGLADEADPAYPSRRLQRALTAIFCDSATPRPELTRRHGLV